MDTKEEAVVERRKKKRLLSVFAARRGRSDRIFVELLKCVPFNTDINMPEAKIVLKTYKVLIAQSTLFFVSACPERERSRKKLSNKLNSARLRTQLGLGVLVPHIQEMKFN